jgi:hypothetical protein
MTDEVELIQGIKALFSSLEKVFSKMGFSKEQVVIMDITAGSYIVTNPPSYLPRIICSVNADSNFKFEYSQFHEKNLFHFELFLNELFRHNISFLEGELIDSLSGSILDDFSNISSEYSGIKKHFLNSINLNNEDLSSLKIYATFKFNLGNKTKKDTKKILKSQSETKIIPDSDLETKKILRFIENRTSKCIQSRHLLELYPKASKSDCLNKLKTIAKNGYVTQSGPWFILEEK